MGSFKYINYSKEVVTMTTKTTTRKSTKAPAAKKETKQVSPRIAFDQADNNTRRATGSGAKPFWYLNRKGDLSIVTDESSNEVLGIKMIDIFEPTENQVKAGILCKVRLQTHAATIDNISIFASDFAEGDIYMQMGGGRNIGSDEAPKWVRDCKLTAHAKAQILSYVHTLLVIEE
jgi:hypothetical protein